MAEQTEQWFLRGNWRPMLEERTENELQFVFGALLEHRTPVPSKKPLLCLFRHSLSPQ